MPYVSIEGPAIDVEKKRKLALAVTEAAAEVFGLPPQAIIVTMKEVASDSVAVGGKLICDKQK